MQDVPEVFAELVERPGIVPAPYLARNRWQPEDALSGAAEIKHLIGSFVASLVLREAAEEATRQSRLTTTLFMLM